MSQSEILMNHPARAGVNAGVYLKRYKKRNEFIAHFK
jgi:hypothetical protein